MGWSLPYPLTGSEIAFRLSTGIRGIYVIWGDKDTHPLYYGRSDGTPTSCVRKRLIAHANHEGNKIISMLLKTGDAGTLRFQYKECTDTRFEEAEFIRTGMPTANRRRELKSFNLD